MRERARRGGFAVLAVAAILGLVAAGCNSGDSSSSDGGPSGTTPGGQSASVTIAPKGKPKPGGKLVYGLEAETDGFNPTASRWAISGLDVANAVFDPLMAYDANGVAQPYLLESSTHNADYTEWTGKIRPGIKFHNGQPLNAQVLKKLTEAHMNSPLTGSAAEPIKGAEVVDDLTIKTLMKRPWVAYPNILTAQGGMVPTPEMFDAGSDLAKKPIGTGPFMFKEWQPNNKFVVVKNPNYWRKDVDGNALPYLDEVEFRPLPDAQSRVAALNAGSVNAIHTNTDEIISELNDSAHSGKIQLWYDNGPAEKSEIMLNTAKAPLDDVRVRKALAYATDPKQIALVQGADESKVVDGPFSKSSKWYASTSYPQYDPAKAKELLDQYAKEKGPVKIVLGTTPTPEAQKVTQTIGEQWRAVGVDVQQRDFEQASFILKVVTGDYDAVLWRQYGDPDPDTEYHWWISTNAKPIGTLSLNMTRIKDSKIDDGLNKGRQTADENERKAAYKTMQEGMAEQVPYVWLLDTTWVVAADLSVRDLPNGLLPDNKTPSLPFVNGSHRLTQAWLER